MSSNNEIEQNYFEDISKKLSDSGVSVRKKVVKIFRELLSIRPEYVLVVGFSFARFVLISFS
jgi:hypothetical protein